eukprot:24086-Chlamydomonas_euryale.AAC.2
MTCEGRATPSSDRLRHFVKTGKRLPDGAPLPICDADEAAAAAAAAAVCAAGVGQLLRGLDAGDCPVWGLEREDERSRTASSSFWPSPTDAAG